MSEAYRIQFEPELDYQPVLPFDIDARDISGEELRTARRSLWRTREESKQHPKCSLCYPRQDEMAARLGVGKRNYQSWEYAGVSTPAWCAIVREIIVAGAEIPIVAASPKQVAAVADVMGGRTPLAELLGLEWPEAITRYCSDGAPIRGGVGPLIAWLAVECGLRGLDRIPNRPGKLAADDILDIRTRAGDGEYYDSIREDYDISRSMVSMIVRRKAYAWVD